MAGNRKNAKVTLEDGFEGEVVRGNIRVEFNAAGITVTKNGAKLYPITTLHPAANEIAAPQAQGEPQIGQIMPDGMKNMGISPETGEPFYVDADDAPGFYNFDEARNYAASQGKRVPSVGELYVLFNNKAVIGGFQPMRAPPEEWYWTSEPYCDESKAYARRASDGYCNCFPRTWGMYLRLVR